MALQNENSQKNIHCNHFDCGSGADNHFECGRANNHFDCGSADNHFECDSSDAISIWNNRENCLKYCTSLYIRKKMYM